MPPAIVDAMELFKSQLLAREQVQMQETASRWMQIERTLQSEIEALAQDMANMRANGTAVSSWHLFRMERYQALLSQVQAEMTRYIDGYALPLITDQQGALAQLAIDHSTTLVQAAYSEAGVVRGAFDVLPVEATQNMVGAAGNGLPLRRLLMDAYPSSANGLTDLLVRNTALGINPRETARRAMRNGLAQGLNRILTIARTEQLRVYREASRQNYQQSGVVTGYRRIETKDSRTCMACIVADGTFYELSQDFIEHPNGRGALIPVIDGIRERKWETALDWFNRQPAASKRQQMGSQYYQAWQDGKFELEQLSKTVPNDTWGASLQVTPLRDLVSE